jgi:transposase-like protein
MDGEPLPVPIHLREESAAFLKLESVLWSDGPIWPHCGTQNRAGRVNGRGARIGLWFCLSCRKQFRATIGTAFERSHVPLHQWFLALSLLLYGTPTNALRLRWALGVTYNTAHRVVRTIEAAGVKHARSFDDAILLLARSRKSRSAQRPPVQIVSADAKTNR